MIEAEAAILKLEQELAGIDGLVQQMQASVDSASAARERFVVQLDAQEKRRFAREQPALPPPSILGYAEQSRLLLESLKANAVAEKAKRAAETVKKRHELRKKNAAEFARLLEEIKKLGAKLPDVDPDDFDKIYRQAGDSFGEVLDDPEGKDRALSKVVSKVRKFLDRNDAVIGGLRKADPDGETAYARMEALSLKITDMVTSGVVYAGPDYHKAWEPARAKLMNAAEVRAGVGRKLIALEKDLQAAGMDLDGYRGKASAAAADTETLLAQAAETGSGNSPDIHYLRIVQDEDASAPVLLVTMIRSGARSRLRNTLR